MFSLYCYGVLNFLYYIYIYIYILYVCMYVFFSLFIISSIFYIVIINYPTNRYRTEKESNGLAIHITMTQKL